MIAFIGRADLMAHVGQEFGLHARGFFGDLPGPAGFFLLLLALGEPVPRLPQRLPHLCQLLFQLGAQLALLGQESG